MSTILDRIVAGKRLEIAERRGRISQANLEAQLADAPPVRDFAGALSKRPPHQVHPHRLAVIAEIKKASPSAGVIRADFDPVALARMYAESGADALSVLTDEPNFHGHLDYLTAVRRAVSPPVLRKDFILDPYQVVEARVAGADAVLLIAEILDDNQLRGLIGQIRALGMEALVELYEPANLPRVLEAGAKVVGVNNRDLRSFTVKFEQTLELAPLVPDDCILVSESGIRSRDDMKRLEEAGVDAVLIGETFMRSADIGATMRELRGE